MKLLACLLLIGCTHKAPVVRVPAEPILIQEPDLEGCVTDEAGKNYWVGVDGMIGIGPTCAQAFEDWKHTKPPVVLDRI